MCRNIKTLFNFEPPATEDEIRAASLQFVRKLSGFNSPSQANRAAFERATADVAAVARTLIESLVTTAAPRDREGEAERAKARSAARFGQQSSCALRCPRGRSVSDSNFLICSGDNTACSFVTVSCFSSS
jgi:hypothetical protein